MSALDGQTTPPDRIVGSTGTVVLVLVAPVDPTAAGALCRRLERLLAGEGVRRVFCDVGAVEQPDLAAVDAVARLRLIAQRRGLRLRLVHAGSALRELLVLAGLHETIPPDELHETIPPDDTTGCRSVTRVRRQAEQREEARVEELGEADDAAS